MLGHPRHDPHLRLLLVRTHHPRQVAFRPGDWPGEGFTPGPTEYFGVRIPRRGVNRRCSGGAKQQKAKNPFSKLNEITKLVSFFLRQREDVRDEANACRVESRRLTERLGQNVDTRGSWP